MSADTHLTTEDREKAMADAQKLMKSQAAGKEKPKSRAYYRVHATHALTGSPVQSKDSAAIKAEKAAAAAVGRNKVADAGIQLAHGAFEGVKSGLSSIAPAKSVVQFAEPGLAVPEDIGTASLKVVRSGTLMSTITVRYSTKAGTATAGLDYTEVSGDLTFFPGQSFASIKVPILEDDEVEQKETFTVLLEAPEKGQVIVGETNECTVTIEDNDSPGDLKFDKEYIPVKESAGKVTCTVVRVGGTAGSVGCRYTTKEKSAKHGADFIHTEGELIFGPGVTRKEVTIDVVDDANFEKDETFQLVLTDASGGAAFTRDTDGGSARAICTIKILNDEQRQTLLGLMVSKLDLDRTLALALALAPALALALALTLTRCPSSTSTWTASSSRGSTTGSRSAPASTTTAARAPPRCSTFSPSPSRSSSPSRLRPSSAVVGLASWRRSSSSVASPHSSATSPPTWAAAWGCCPPSPPSPSSPWVPRCPTPSPRSSLRWASRMPTTPSVTSPAPTASTES